ncbi:MAG: glutathione binding-like protein [Proteobacteria bacterium]|nr:glutathione binding-like protein [Pseudomonadota bacterium]
MSKNPVLVTLLPSADVDIGRWLLQRWQINYDEQPHAPIFHVLALKWYGVGNADSPLFICDDQKYPGIEAMVKRFNPLAAPENRVLPDEVTEKALHDEVMKLQHDFRFGMGVGTVHWAYYQLLSHKNLTWASFTTGVPWFETLFLTFGYSLIKFMMFKGLSLSAEQAQKGLDKVKDGFDRCEQILSDGRQYLAADRLTLADLAFAACGAPMVLADGYGGRLPTIDEVTPEMRSVVTEMRARPAGAYVKRLYDEHRLKVPARSGAV